MNLTHQLPNIIGDVNNNASQILNHVLDTDEISFMRVDKPIH